MLKQNSTQMNWKKEVFPPMQRALPMEVALAEEHSLEIYEFQYKWTEEASLSNLFGTANWTTQINNTISMLDKFYSKVSARLNADEHRLLFEARLRYFATEPSN